MSSHFFRIFRDYEEVSVRYDEKCKAVWCYYNPAPRPCFSETVLREARQVQQAVVDYFSERKTASPPLINYVIIASQVPGIFNFGGDLKLFVELIKEKDRQQLFNYAKMCIDICYMNAVNLHLPVTTISLVEGSALGGGFESALSSNVLIATENSEMGFPEIRFNLFPGMGAYSLLARSHSMAVAEKMISGGEIYSGRELFEMGIVHHLLDDDGAYAGVQKFIAQHQRVGNGRRALMKVRQRYSPLDYQELLDITAIWVDTAMNLEDKDLRLMERLVKSQSAKISSGSKQRGQLLRTRQDRRLGSEDVVFPLFDWSGKLVKQDRRKNPDRRLSVCSVSAEA